MNVFVATAVGWLLIGSLVATAVLMEHFRTASRFPQKAGWWLIPVLFIGWPWPVWVWYRSHIETSRTARLAVLVGVIGFGWGCGLNLYDFLYPKALDPPDIPALNVMIEGIISDPSTKNEQSQVGIPPRLFIFR
jgi:hypothetical protein